MITRLAGFAIFVFWAVATSWLVWHDILPAWTAQDPPRVVAADWVRTYGRNSQFGIFNPQGQRVGGVWTRYTSAASTDREDDIFIEQFPGLGPAHINVKSVYDIQGRLDELDIAVLGFWNPIRIHGERFPTQFAFSVEAGPINEVFKIDLRLAGMISDSFSPFHAMPELRVGQAWRMQVFNPIAAVTGLGEQFIPMLVKVVGRELIRVDGELTDCLIIETPHAKAWVERRSGRVLLQELDLPVGGKYSVRYEPYSEPQRQRAERDFDRYLKQTTRLYRP